MQAKSDRRRKGILGKCLHADSNKAKQSGIKKTVRRGRVSMSKGLKGITLEIDGNTTKLVSALGNVTKASKETQNELKGIESQLKFSPQNTELLAQKQQVLKEAVAATEEKLITLTEAQKQMAAAGVDIGDDKYRDLQREIIATKQKLSSLTAEQAEVKKLADSFVTLKDKFTAFANKIPLVNKVTTAFGKVKDKIKQTADESKTLQKISTAVETVKGKVSGFVEKVPILNKVGTAFRGIKQKADELKGSLPSISQGLKAVGSAAATLGKGGLQVVGTTVSTTAKAFAAFSTAAITAGVAIGKQALEQYADYEQLVGGVETLFGAGGQSLRQYAKSVGKSMSESAEEYKKLTAAQEEVIKNADNAYKTAGLSANEYMETVTSVSAALIASVGGDTEEAAKKADLAITDMADNANKMGSDISGIQTAYQGFAKQNYTMLDNLKLGYGGTKTEMERLLEDATKISGVKYDIDSYADIVDAIHEVQTEMGITGTTAKEASSTISGSIGMTKAAWTNLMAGLADSDADLGQLVDNLVDSALSVADNILPKVLEIVPNIVAVVPKLIEGLSGKVGEIGTTLSTLILQMIPTLTNAFFKLIQSVIVLIPTLLPQMVQESVNLFMGLIDGINTTIPMLMAMIPQMITDLVAILTANLPQIINGGVMILVNLIQGITDAIPTLITAIIALLPVIVSAVVENLPLIIEAGINLLIALVTGIVQAIPQLIAMLPTIINTIVTTLLQMLPQIIEAGIQLLNAIVSGIIQAIPQLIAALPTVISSVVNTIIKNLPQIISAGIQLIGALISGIIRAIPQLIAALPKVVKAIFDTLKAIDWGELGKNIIDGIKDGIANAAKGLASAVMDAAKSALDAVKKFLGIHSPSTVFRDQVGKQMAAGAGIGFTTEMAKEADNMAKSIPTNFDSYISAKGARKQETNAQVGVGGFVQNLTINSTEPLTPSEVARQTRNATRQMVLKLRTA